MEADLAQTFALDGRTAVVTGAASGIGRETAIVLARAGAQVVIGDIDAAGLAETTRLVEQAGGTAEAATANVAVRAEIDALAQCAIARFDRIDVWVNCAGTILSRSLLDTEEEDLERVVSVNLEGVYWGCIAAGRAMKESGAGVIINISSGGGEAPVPGLSLYSMTKAAVNMLTRTVAKELGPFGIRANAVAPGWIDTPMGLHSFRDAEGGVQPDQYEAALRSRGSASPLGLTGTPHDIALAVLYLAGDASRFVTGQILRPNGGVAMP